MPVFEADARIAGVAMGGSYLTNTMDQFSDLDILVVTQAENHAEVMADRPRIARSLGPLLEQFTGEHVGEPSLLICLYGPPLLHVDLKFITANDLRSRVEQHAVLWERDGQLTRALSEGTANYPAPNRQWIEDRFWIWVHYGAGKIGRGEIFEAIEFISYLRANVLGPLGLQAAGARPGGVRKIEIFAPEFSRVLVQTVATYDASDCARAGRSPRSALSLESTTTTRLPCPTAIRSTRALTSITSLCSTAMSASAASWRTRMSKLASAGSMVGVVVSMGYLPFTKMAA